MWTWKADLLPRRRIVEAETGSRRRCSKRKVRMERTTRGRRASVRRKRTVGSIGSRFIGKRKSEYLDLEHARTGEGEREVEERRYDSSEVREMKIQTASSMLGGDTRTTSWP